MSCEYRPRRLLVTGAAGFIGAHFVEQALARAASVEVAAFDALTYAGRRDSLSEAEAAHPGRFRFIHGDIRDAATVAAAFESFQPDTVVHFAAESHVDRSIDQPLAFVETNVLGTGVLLNAARAAWGPRKDVRFHHVSTDEVYGSLGEDGFFREDTAYDPSSPYSASKAASDHLVRAWQRTFDLPATITNCSNNYGPRQFPEKLIPLMIGNALAGKPLPVYGDGANIRDWLHVVDHCDAILTVLEKGVPGRTYNVGGRSELSNLRLVHLLCDLLDELRPRAEGSHRKLMTFVPDRPGHDRRYAIDNSRIAGELGWQPAHTLEQGMRETVQWYMTHAEWSERIRREIYDGRRLGKG